MREAARGGIGARVTRFVTRTVGVPDPISRASVGQRNRWCYGLRKNQIGGGCVVEAGAKRQDAESLFGGGAGVFATRRGQMG